MKQLFCKFSSDKIEHILYWTIVEVKNKKDATEDIRNSAILVETWKSRQEETRWLTMDEL